MLASPRVRAVALLTLALSASAFVPRTHLAPGLTFDMVSITTTSMATPGANASFTGRGTVGANGAMRLEFASLDGSASAVYAVGDYVLTTEGRSLLVRPASKTYIDVVNQAMSSLNSLPPEMLAQLTVTGVSGTTEKVGGSEPIEGRPTEHYHSTMTYNMNMMGQSIPTTIVSDYWITKFPITFANPLAGGTKSPVATGPMAELMLKQMELAPPASAGVALKSTTVQTVSFMGQSIVTTTTSEMKNVKEADVDPSTLVLPAGYTKVEK